MTSVITGVVLVAAGLVVRFCPGRRIAARTRELGTGLVLFGLVCVIVSFGGSR